MNKKILFIIIILAIFAFIFSLYFFQDNSNNLPSDKQQNGDNQNVIENGIEFEDVNSTITESTEIEGWKNYVDEVFGFSISYPKDWFSDRYSMNKVILFGEQNYVDVKNESGVMEKQLIMKIGLTAKIYNNVSELWQNEEEKLNLEDWLNKNYLPLSEGEVLEPFIFGTGDYSGFLLKKEKGVGVIKLIDIVYVQNGNLIYELTSNVPGISTSSFPTTYDYDEVFNKMIETFKFIEKQ